MKTQFQKHYFIALLLFLTATVVASAQETILVLSHANGSTTNISLNDKPRVVFGSNNLYIRSTTFALEFQRKDVVSFAFKDVDTGIGNVKAETDFRIEDNQIVFYGIKHANDIRVYDLNGRRLTVSPIACGECLTLPLSQLSVACIIATSHRSFKFGKP